MKDELQTGTDESIYLCKGIIKEQSFTKERIWIEIKWNEMKWIVSNSRSNFARFQMQNPSLWLFLVYSLYSHFLLFPFSSLESATPNSQSNTCFQILLLFELLSFEQLPIRKQQIQICILDTKNKRERRWKTRRKWMYASNALLSKPLVVLAVASPAKLPDFCSTESCAARTILSTSLSPCLIQITSRVWSSSLVNVDVVKVVVC